MNQHAPEGTRSSAGVFQTVLASLLASALLAIAVVAVQWVSGGKLISVLGGVARSEVLQVVPVTSEEFQWRQNSPLVPMVPTKEGLCYLVEITGRFEGSDEAVFIREQNDFWWLGGKSRRSGVAAKARCWVFPPHFLVAAWEQSEGS